MSTGEKCTDVPIGQAVGYFKYGSFSEYMVSVCFLIYKIIIKTVLSSLEYFLAFPASLTLV